MKPGYVYRAFNAVGELLYVGASLTPGRRFASHQSQTAWWNEVANITLEAHPSRMHALAAEGAAIEAERPHYNVFGPRGVLNPDEWLRRREEAERERYLERTYDAQGRVFCTTCERRPERIPKGITLDALVCKRCHCKSLILDVTEIAA